MITERVGAYTHHTKTRVRSAVMGMLAVVAVIAASGCAVFDPSHPPTASQTKTLGPVAVTLTVCATLATQTTPPPGSCTQDNGNSGKEVQSAGPTQVFLGFRVPAGTGAPTSFTSSSTGPTDSGPQLQFAQNSQYASELQRLMPASTGEEWVGYSSQYVDYVNTSGEQNFTATIDFGLPTHANGSPFSGPFTWQAVVGARTFSGYGGPTAQNAPVDCESSLTLAWGGSDPAWVCVDDQSPTTLGADNSLATRDAGIAAGSPTPAVAGTVASVPFNLAYAGDATPAATFTLSAATSLAGATATPSQSTLAPATNSSSPVNVSVPVPTDAAPGSYDVTLTGVLPDGETRAGTAQLIVTAPPAPIAQAALPTATPPPARCQVPRLSGKTVGKATALLRRDNCRLGKVKGRHAQARKGTVIAQSPGAGHVLAAGGLVSVTESLGPSHRRR